MLDATECADGDARQAKQSGSSVAIVKAYIQAPRHRQASVLVEGGENQWPTSLPSLVHEEPDIGRSPILNGHLAQGAAEAWALDHLPRGGTGYGQQQGGPVDDVAGLGHSRQAESHWVLQGKLGDMVAEALVCDSNAVYVRLYCHLRAPSNESIWMKQVCPVTFCDLFYDVLDYVLLLCGCCRDAQPASHTAEQGFLPWSADPDR